MYTPPPTGPVETSTPAPELAELLHAGPRRAPVTAALLACNILIFLAMLANGAGVWHTSSVVPLAWGANFGPATQDGQWWRLVSALFLHFGLIHLALNMWALWDVGRLMEQLLGRWRFALLYLGSGVLGNLLSLVVQGNVAVSGGASGAIFSLYGALLVFLWRERRQVDRSEFRWFFGAAVVFTVFALVMGQLVPGIDNAAHMGGLIAGATFAGVLMRPWTAKSPLLPAMRPASAGLLLLASALLVGNIPAPTYLLGNELQAREAIRHFLDEDRRVSRQWESMLDRAVETQLPFDHLAVQVDSIVTTPYQESFDQLSALNLEAAAPSARTLDMLLRYASLRTDASQAFSDALRKRDLQKIREALENARSAPQRAQAPPALPDASAPRPPASTSWP